jgi:hypothetical protein
MAALTGRSVVSDAHDSDLDRDRVDLGCGMARSLVDLLHGFGIRGFGHAPDHPGLGVSPRSLEVDALLALDIKVGLMCGLESFRGDAMHPVMDVHELRHFVLLTRYPGDTQWYLS